MRIIQFLVAILVLLCSCSKSFKDARENYINKEREIGLVRSYFEQIHPPDLRIHLIFEGKDEVSIIIWQKDSGNKASWIQNSLFDKYGMGQVWNQPTNSPRVKQFLRLLDWEAETLDSLYKLLSDANCYSVSSHFPLEHTNKQYISIGYPTNDVYGLTYQLYDTALTKEEQKSFSDKNKVEVVNEKLIIKYEGPAWE
jgi:hypothetical protein